MQPGAALTVPASGTSLPAGRVSQWAEAATSLLRCNGRQAPLPQTPRDGFPGVPRGQERWEADALLVGAAQQQEETLQMAERKRLQADTSPIR